MNLAELKHAVDFMHSTVRSYEKPEDLGVVLVINEPSMGGRMAVNIDSVTRGFDWEEGRINIVASEKIVKKGNSKEDVIAPYEKEYDYGNGKKTMIRDCRMCGGQVKKDNRYCAHCGQKLK